MTENAAPAGGATSDSTISVAQQTAPRSPALSSRTNPATVALGPESKQLQSDVVPPAYAAGRSPIDTNIPHASSANGLSMSQSQIFSSPTVSSPMATVMPGGIAADERASEPHLSGHEPRYFPGVMQRRRGSTRQNSMHEGDDSAAKRPVGRREFPTE